MVSGTPVQAATAVISSHGGDTSGQGRESLRLPPDHQLVTWCDLAGSLVTSIPDKVRVSAEKEKKPSGLLDGEELDVLRDLDLERVRMQEGNRKCL